MKVKIKSPENQTNSKNLETHKASIGNINVIVDLLRRHYAHPIRTTVQEYLSNARDSHREAKVNKAINVSLPTKASPVFKIRDFGVGMSVERLKENFLSYGNSTKSNSNDQTGGFGIGSKSGWTYTPTFYIKTFLNKTETLYEASIAQHYEGALTKLSSKETKEENGVEIQIPVQISDIPKFISAFYRTTYFWEEEVNVINMTKEELLNKWVNKEYIATENGFFILNKYKYDCFSIFGISDLGDIVVLDGIPYEADSLIRDVDIPYGSILRLKTGELKVAISRESIEDNKENSLAIKEKAKKILGDKKEFFDKIKNKLIPEKTMAFLEACAFFDKKHREHSVLNTFFSCMYFNPKTNEVLLDKKKDDVVLSNIRIGIKIVLTLPNLSMGFLYKNRMYNYSYATNMNELDSTSSFKPVGFILNDSRESPSKVDQIMKKMTRVESFKDYQTIFVINNCSHKEAQELSSYVSCFKLSEIVEKQQKEESLIKKQKKELGIKEEKKIKEVKTDITCEKFHYSGGERFRRAILNENRETVILSKNQDSIEFYIKNIQELEDYSNFDVIFVEEKNMSLFNDKKYYKKENFLSMKCIIELKREIKYLLALDKMKGVDDYYALQEIIKKLKILGLEDSVFLAQNHDFQRLKSSVKGLAKLLKVQKDLKLKKIVDKIRKNRYYKYIVFYINDDEYPDREWISIKKDLGL